MEAEGWVNMNRITISQDAHALNGARGFEQILTLPRLLLGIILSGSPYSVYDPSAPHVDPDVFTLGVPVLGICYGLQEIARTHGGQVEAHTHREYGYAKIQVEKLGGHGDRLFDGIEIDADGMQVGLLTEPHLRSPQLLHEEIWTWLIVAGLDEPRRPTHFPPPWLPDDRPYFYITFYRYLPRAEGHLWCSIPPRSLAQSERQGSHCRFREECLWDQGRMEHGKSSIAQVCAVADHAQDSFIPKEIARIREICGDRGQVIGAVSGGVDSTVAAKLMHEAIGDR